MQSNRPQICLNCGRTFMSHPKRKIFCSINCKNRYTNHKSFNCNDCRTTECPYRNRGLKAIPNDCPNYKWDSHKTR